ncbi:MAG: SUMF1/EgtB/PvdO family nonheme iron enzyme [Bacteroidia bacterium]
MTLPFAPATTAETLEKDMVFVEGGSFMMGDNINKEERPIHKVVVDSFYICRFPVIQTLWKVIMGNYPEKLDSLHPMRPVEGISWEDSQVFIRKLNSISDKVYRLPTEAEWEFAAQGGKYSQGFIYAGSANLMEAGWYNENSQDITHHVGLKRPNELGLFDMSGNVYEWCQDWYERNYYTRVAKESIINNPKGPENGESRVARGGSFGENYFDCRVKSRCSFRPSLLFSDLGFRLCRS